MDLQKVGRSISLILHHKPETIVITLDEHGWANVDELKEVLQRSIQNLTKKSWRKLLGQTISSDIHSMLA